jgi:hypothetical protein
MTIRLTDSQRDFLRREPLPQGAPNKIRRACEVAGVSLRWLAEATEMHLQQLYRYTGGRDLYLSTACRIAAALGCEVTDLWPVPPEPKAQRRVRKSAKLRRSKATKTNGREKASVAA